MWVEEEQKRSGAQLGSDCIPRLGGLGKEPVLSPVTSAALLSRLGAVFLELTCCRLRDSHKASREQMAVVIVSRLLPSSVASLCPPHFREGDQFGVVLGLAALSTRGVWLALSHLSLKKSPVRESPAPSQWSEWKLGELGSHSTRRNQNSDGFDQIHLFSPQFENGAALVFSMGSPGRVQHAASSLPWSLAPALSWRSGHRGRRRLWKWWWVGIGCPTE